MAIKKSPSLSKMLVTLSRYAASVRVSILKSPNFIKKKVRLQVENKTRWSSSFLMLESFYRAHQASAFLEDNPCPVTYERIQKYLLIVWQTWYEARITYAKRYTKHLLGS